MRIIEIKSLSNGSHRNQTGSFSIVPNGWAVIPDDMDTQNFPFGEVTVEDIGGVTTVTNWKAAVIPETKEPEKPVTEIEQLRADVDYLAIMTGVEL